MNKEKNETAAYRIGNEMVTLAFDARTGAIVRFYDEKMNYDLIAQSRLAAGLNILVPLEGQRNNRARSERQRLSGFYRSEDGQSAKLVFDKLATDFAGTVDVSVEIAVRLEERSAVFELLLKNNSPYTVEEVQYPCLGGVKKGEKDAPLISRTMQFQGGFSDVFLGDGLPNPGYWGTDHPMIEKNFPAPETCTPFVLLERGEKGLYLGVHTPEPKFIGFIDEYKPGYADNKHHRLLRDGEIPEVPAGFEVRVSRLPFIAPGETMRLDPVVAGFYEGDWHTGVRYYQEWRKTWYQAVKRPSWLDDSDCWMTLHINSPEGCCRYQYSELPAIMREAKKSGVKVLQLIGWARGGQDGEEPYQDTEDLLGTREELKEAIAEIEAMDIHVLLMCKFKWADQSTAEYQEELYPLTMKDVFGNPVYFGGYSYQTTLQRISGGSRRVGAGMCHLSKEYRKIAVRELDKILDLRPSGILYDELANPLLLCFDRSHGHRPGECIHIGTVELAKEFYQAGVEKLGEDFFMGGEGPNDFLSQYFLGDYIRSNDGNMGEAVHTPVWKFINPQWHIATCLVGFDDREMVNQCMTYGYAMNYEIYNFKGVPKDAPCTVKAVMEAQKLRMQLKDYIWNGIFRHTAGVEVENTGDGCEYIYSLFINPKNNRRAVVVANQSESTALQAVVNVEGIDSYSLYRPGKETPETCGKEITVEPRSFCVLIENA